MVVVEVKASATSLRDAMIRSAALTAQHSANGSNCYEASYHLPVPPKKRWWGFPASNPSSWRSWGTRRSASLMKRDTNSKTLCNAIGFAGVQYYSKCWRTAENPSSTDYIDAEWNFEVSKQEKTLQCDFIAGLIDALAVVAPEFAVEDVELGEEIAVLCEESMEHA